MEINEKETATQLIYTDREENGDFSITIITFNSKEEKDEYMRRRRELFEYMKKKGLL